MGIPAGRTTRVEAWGFGGIQGMSKAYLKGGNGRDKGAKDLRGYMDALVVRLRSLSIS